ncbi:hypothetical protein C8R45DRAFT_929298 [Mycena sanguinolenta]|nr:hypothetical protein C8R45DRAFT_929298 [Mycena sanguinolenta]
MCALISTPRELPISKPSYFRPPLEAHQYKFWLFPPNRISKPSYQPASWALGSVGDIVLDLHIRGPYPDDGIFTFTYTVAVQELLSRIKGKAPISGFYGPGSWCSRLITLGMTHGHMGVSWWTTGELEEGWDYDLMGASGYIVAAAIDLIHKSRAIARLGEAASESPLLPALLCAEQVLLVGTGSSIFTIVTAFGFRDWAARLRRAGIAVIPLLLALIGLWFARNAHLAIFRTTSVLWRGLSNIATQEYVGDIYFTLIDLPPCFLHHLASFQWVYESQVYVALAKLVGFMVAWVALGQSIVDRNPMFPDCLSWTSTSSRLCLVLWSLRHFAVVDGFSWPCITVLDRHRTNFYLYRIHHNIRAVASNAQFMLGTASFQR